MLCIIHICYTYIENVLFVSISRANKSNVCAAGILSVFTK